MKKKRIMPLCLALVALMSLQAMASAGVFEPYWGYCKNAFPLFAKEHDSGDRFPNALHKDQVVRVIGQEGDMLEVIACTWSGESKKAWLWDSDVSPAVNNDWHKLLCVNNSGTGDRLHLRLKPNRYAMSLGKYYSGVSPVALGPSIHGWTKVRIDVREGYMQTKFLLDESGGDVPLPGMPILTIVPKSGSRVQLKRDPWQEASNLGWHANGETVKLLGIASAWCHVETNDGFTGFMPVSVFPSQIE